jgi:dihydroorotase-like cyclic amidohydrolase
MCSNGARLHGLYPRKGAILPGSDADLVLVDRDATKVISAESLVTHAREVAHLFYGRNFRGSVVRTLLAGRTVYADGEVTGPKGGGRFVRSDRQDSSDGRRR